MLNLYPLVLGLLVTCVFIYYINYLIGVSPRCLSLASSGIKAQSGDSQKEEEEEAHSGVWQMWQDYRGSFCSWNKNWVCVIEAISQME